MAHFEKSFIQFGSRRTMVKIIKELENINLIEFKTSAESRMRLLKIKEN